MINEHDSGGDSDCLRDADPADADQGKAALMVYLDYVRFSDCYIQTQRGFSELLNEKERLFAKTQPKSTDYGKDKVQSGAPENPFDAYLIAKEEKRIDERLEEMKKLLEDRKMLVDMKRQELGQSLEIKDRLYVMRFLQHRKIKYIAKKVVYSESQVYRMIGAMLDEIKNMRENAIF